MSWLLRILRWVYCTVIAWSAVRMLLDALRFDDTHVIVLSVAELVAVAAFVFRPLEIPALAVLLTAFAISGTMQPPSDDVPLRFLFFAATAAFIVVASRVKAEASSIQTD